MAIVRTALQRDATRRYASAGEMGQACEHFLYDKGYGPTNLTLKQYLHALFPEFKPPRAATREEFPLIEPTLIPIGDGRRDRGGARGARKTRRPSRPSSAPTTSRCLRTRRPPWPRGPRVPGRHDGSSHACGGADPPRAARALHRPTSGAHRRHRRALGLAAALLVTFVTGGPVEVGVDSALWRHFASGGGGRLRDA